MTHKSTYQGIEFVSEEEYQTDLYAWFDNLPKSEVKTAITKIKCREYRPYEQASFRLIVLCDHPFSLQANDSHDERYSEDDALINRHLNALIPVFSNWIDRHDMPEEVMLGSHYAFVDWLPKEMLPHVLNDSSPHVQAQREMDNHLLDCLELIRLTTLNNREFAELWQNSNEPFFAAGRLIYGDFQWVREVPSTYFYDEASVETLLDRVGEYSREYVGLMRLASLAGAESPLLERVLFVIRRFKMGHALEIPGWQALARDQLDDICEKPRITGENLTQYYADIDRVCDQLRRDLIQATRGQHNEIVTIINAILPTLDVPKSSILFTDKAER